MLWILSFCSGTSDEELIFAYYMLLILAWRSVKWGRIQDILMLYPSHICDSLRFIFYALLHMYVQVEASSKELPINIEQMMLFFSLWVQQNELWMHEVDVKRKKNKWTMQFQLNHNLCPIHMHKLYCRCLLLLLLEFPLRELWRGKWRSDGTLSLNLISFFTFHKFQANI